MARRFHIALEGRRRGKKARKKYGIASGGGKKRCAKFQRKDRNPKSIKSHRYKLNRLLKRC